MKYPGDIVYLLKYVFYGGADVFVAVAILMIVLVSAWYFLKRRKKAGPS
jgi:LPXTG-motif cell wall-anchored protein